MGRNVINFKNIFKSAHRKRGNLDAYITYITNRSVNITDTHSYNHIKLCACVRVCVYYEIKIFKQAKPIILID